MGKRPPDLTEGAGFNIGTHPEKGNRIDFLGPFWYVNNSFDVRIAPRKECRMAQHKSAEKRARTAVRRADRNTQWKSRMRSAIKKVRAATEKVKGETELRKTVKLLDQLAAKGIIHRNKAANQKSALTRFINTLK